MRVIYGVTVVQYGTKIIRGCSITLFEKILRKLLFNIDLYFKYLARHGGSCLVIPAFWEAEAGGSAEVRSLSLADVVKPCLYEN